MVLGLRHLLTKSGNDTLSTFKEVLEDISEASKLCDNDINKKILLNISSTMSDRAATQVKFNELLEDYRTEILQEKLEDAWNNMNELEQKSLSKLNNFFCGLHSLVHAAEDVSSCLIEFEKCVFGSTPPIHDPTFRKSTESGCLRLIRTVGKAFACGGDEKSGIHGPFDLYVKAFLKENNLLSLPIQRFRGNRFNIIISNAASVYFLSAKIKDFLKSGNDTNRLLKSVKFDISVPEYVAGCKALGLISYLVTVPLWCHIENKTVDILDGTVYYQEIIDYLESSIEHLDEFMTGRTVLSFIFFK